jgi:hypothetical protein
VRRGARGAGAAGRPCASRRHRAAGGRDNLHSLSGPAANCPCNRFAPGAPARSENILAYMASAAPAEAASVVAAAAKSSAAELASELGGQRDVGYE